MAFTFFFRDLHTLDHAVRHVVPYVAGRSKVHVWDAGSAMGQEAYTLSILFSEAMGYFAFKNLRIHTSDLEADFSSVIEKGSYPEAELQRIPRDLFEKYFQPDEQKGYYRVIDLIRNCIIHKTHNLLTLKPIGDNFSLIVCKNVLLHFQHSERVEVIRMFHSSLAPGGFLVMEQTQKLPQELNSLFEQVVPDAQLYRKV